MDRAGAAEAAGAKLPQGGWAGGHLNLCNSKTVSVFLGSPSSCCSVKAPTSHVKSLLANHPHAGVWHRVAHWLFRGRPLLMFACPPCVKLTFNFMIKCRNLGLVEFFCPQILQNAVKKKNAYALLLPIKRKGKKRTLVEKHWEILIWRWGGDSPLGNTSDHVNRILAFSNLVCPLLLR